MAQTDATTEVGIEVLVTKADDKDDAEEEGREVLYSAPTFDMPVDAIQDMALKRVRDIPAGFAVQFLFETSDKTPEHALSEAKARIRDDSDIPDKVAEELTIL